MAYTGKKPIDFVDVTQTKDFTVTEDLTVDTNTLVVDSTNNKVGIGTSSPARELSIGDGTGSPNIQLLAANTGNSRLEFGDTDDSDVGEIQYLHGDNAMLFHVNATERLRIDSSGNVLVGKSATDSTTAGVDLRPEGVGVFVRDGNRPLIANRLTSDGTIAEFRKDGTAIGSIGTFNGYPFYGHATQSGAGLMYVSTSIRPFDCNTQTQSDNEFDLGTGSTRFDDVYATNGSIQTSDENEKQQIASLTDAEITAAKAISTLFKTFKWNDKVEAKGDAARTHTGVIAQDVQQAMTDAGLDAGDYAFFISATWWETQAEVPAVEADEENGIEAADAYTRTDTYDTAEEAPEGATERTRLGIRYPELLAFVGAATEQRLADIETRLATLEAAD